MLGAKVSVVYDLAGRAAKGAESTRQDLLRALEAGELKGYSTSYKGLNVRLLVGTLVEITQVGWSDDSNVWYVLDGLAVKGVQVTDKGTDHFPVAGVYRTDAGKPSATAIVRWDTTTEYPAREEFVESIVQTSYSDRIADIQINMPVVVTRSWSLVLAAPSIPLAIKAYGDLRSGTWKPAFGFSDALPDSEKIRQVPVRFEPGDPGDK